MTTILCDSLLNPDVNEEKNIIISIRNQLYAIMSMYEINNKVVDGNPEAKAVEREKLKEVALNWSWIEE